MGCIAKIKGHWCLVIANFTFIVPYIHTMLLLIKWIILDFLSLLLCIVNIYVI